MGISGTGQLIQLLNVNQSSCPPDSPIPSIYSSKSLLCSGLLFNFALENTQL